MKIRIEKLYILLSVDFLFRLIGQTSFILFSGAIFLITGKASDLAWVSVATFLPSLFFTYFSNPIAFKFTAKNIILFTTFIRTITFIFFSFNSQNIYMLYLLIAINSSLHQIGITYKRIYDAQVLQPDERVNYNSYKIILSNISLICGPSLGGILISYFGLKISLLSLSFLSIFTFILALAFNYEKIKSSNRTKESDSSIHNNINNNNNNNTKIDSRPKNAFQSLTYICKSGHVGFTILSHCLVGIILEIQSPLLFPFVKEVFHRSTESTGLLFSLAGIGGIIGAMALKNKNRWAQYSLIPTVILIDGLYFLTFTQVSSFLLAAVMFTSLGIMASVTLIIVEGLIQSEVPQSHQPFVFALTQFASGAGGASIGVGACYLTEFFSTKTVLSMTALYEIGIALLLLSAQFFSNIKRGINKKSN